MVSPPTLVDVSVCINGSEVDVRLEEKTSPSNTPIAWNGTSFQGAIFDSFIIKGQTYPEMIVDGELNNEGTMTITIAANGGTAMMDIPFEGDFCIE